MAVLDLQALTDETINELGLDSNNLWLIKIEKKVYGPFETGALKLHSGRFPEQFDEAMASPMMSPNWQPFFSLPQFQRRAPEVLKNTDLEKAQYYALVDGVKDGPYSIKDIEELWQKDELTLTDMISWDEGHHWTKLYLHPQFDRRHRETLGLPALPVENSFLRSEAEMVEKWESEEEKPNLSASLASLAYLNSSSGKTKLNIEEITYKPPQTDEEIFQTEKRKKIAFSAAAVVLVGAISSWLLLSDNNKNAEFAALDNENQFQPSPRAEADESSWKKPTSSRAPASVVPRPVPQTPRPRQEVIDSSSQYAPEVYRESHSNFQEPPVPEPYGEVEAPAMPEEHSLVQGHMPAGEMDQSLDQAFQPTEEAIPEPVPVVEEVSDF